MASSQLTLHRPPVQERALELWLQHAAGRILFEDVRAYATERIDPALSAETRVAVQKGIDEAMYGLMMMIDGVSGVLKNGSQSVELSVIARLVNHQPPGIAAALDLRDGDGMCMGYHRWLDGDYGEDIVALAEP